MVNSAVSFPKTTFNIIASDQKVGFEPNRGLLFVQKTAAGSAQVGLNVNLPQTPAELDALFGPTSMGAFIAKQFRRINPWTFLDAIVFADSASSPVAATATVVFSGTATAAGSLLVSVASRAMHTFEIDVSVGDTAAVVAAALVSAIGLGGSMPFTASVTSATVTFTAANKGTHANTWPLIVTGSVPGITATLTGFANGATDPALTGAFDPIENLRYQHIVWPSTWSRTALKTFMDSRKNVDNDILDGRVFIWEETDFATALSDALTLNSSEMVLMTNKPNALANWKGNHLGEAPDLCAAYFAGLRARRLEPGISISDIVATNESLDQFGGPAMNSLPFFNSPFVGFQQPYPGTGYSQAEQRELENGGVTVVGSNRSNTGIVCGAAVTTWQFDVAGNPDDTWKYLEWRDTHGAIREYVVLNCRKRFSQYRLTGGEAIANRAMATQQMIAGYILGLCVDLMDMTLIQKGQAARQFIQDNMVVTLDLDARSAQVTLVVPMVSQLESILGTIKYTFDFGAQQVAA